MVHAVYMSVKLARPWKNVYLSTRMMLDRCELAEPIHWLGDIIDFSSVKSSKNKKTLPGDFFNKLQTASSTKLYDQEEDKYFKYSSKQFCLQKCMMINRRTYTSKGVWYIAMKTRKM